MLLNWEGLKYSPERQLCAVSCLVCMPVEGREQSEGQETDSSLYRHQPLCQGLGSSPQMPRMGKGSRSQTPIHRVLGVPGGSLRFLCNSRASFT